MPNGNGTGSGSGGKLTEMISRVTTSTPSSARIGASSGAPFSTSGRTAMRSVAQPTSEHEGHHGRHAERRRAIHSFVSRR